MRGVIHAIPPAAMHHDPVWHYTDAGGLAGIATGGPPTKKGDSRGNGCLWATAATTLNDPGELTYGAQRIGEWYELYGAAAPGSEKVHSAIRSALPELEESLLSDPAYVVSASIDGDSLGQWRGYAGPGGYAIELDTWDPEPMTVERPDPNVTFTVAPTWVKVEYQREAQDKLIRLALDDVLDVNRVVGGFAARSDLDAEILVRGRLSSLAAVLKHPSFAEEKEVRLVSFLPPGSDPKFRGTARGLIPYIETTTGIFPHALAETVYSPLPIKSVRVGPPAGDAMRQRVRATRMLLDSTGRSGASVHESEIPYLP